MDYKQFEDNLGSWGLKMRSFIESPQCDQIYSYLKKRSEAGHKIFPAWENTFRAFKETPYNDLKVVFFLFDPYPWEKNGIAVADGIALSCKNTGIEQPSLRLFYDGIIDDLRLSKKVKREPDLSYLCNQGVMLLNSSLTVELNKTGSHSKIRVMDRKVRLWEPFYKFFLEEVIGLYNPGLVLVFCGKESQYYERYVLNPLQHYIFKVEHPSAAEHAERTWKHENIFSKTSRILKQNNNIELNWI